MEDEIVYRYKEYYTDSLVHFIIQKFKVMKYTKKGFWIIFYNEGIIPIEFNCWKRFVLGNAKKKFVHKTIEEAKTSFIARKIRQITILEAQLRRAKTALELIKIRDIDIDKDK